MNEYLATVGLFGIRIEKGQSSSGVCAIYSQEVEPSQNSSIRAWYGGYIEQQTGREADE